MRVLLLGSGGREHALAWKLSQSPQLTKLFIAPGNAGTASLGTNIPISVTDFQGIKQAVTDHDINMVIVGPEDPLVQGIADFFAADPLLEGIAVIGPSASGARLEGSKDFAKQFMINHGIPTAAYQTFSLDTLQEGIAFLNTLKAPYVLKADGLAAGKGVLICHNLEEAVREFRDLLENNRFGNASQKVVVEEFLPGLEVSVFVITDGRTWKLLPEAKDYKRIGEGDTGPNTGGMGTVSPVHFADEAFMSKVTQRIIEPTIHGLISENITYKGFIFIGLMNVGGEPYVIEYNCRLGDPETESILPRLENDLLTLCSAVASGKLEQEKIRVSSMAAATVVLVSRGYPGDYEKNKPVTGESEVIDSLVFHAGTKLSGNGEVLSNGGRVLAVTSLDSTLKGALKKSYTSAGLIRFEGKTMRSDIGFDLCS